MPIYNPQPGAPVPVFTFFVSAGFSGTSPYFNTLAAAVAACDGVNLTRIHVYKGTYVENVTLKNNTYIEGDGIDVTIVQGQTATTDPAAGPAVNVYLERITFRSPGGHGFTQNTTGAGQSIVYARHVLFVSGQANSYGYNYNPAGVFPANQLQAFECQFQNDAAAGGNPGAGLGGNDMFQIGVFKNCFIQRMHFSYQASRHMEFIDCDIYDALLFSQAANANPIIDFFNCVFREYRLSGQANPGFLVTWNLVDCAFRVNGNAAFINGTRQRIVFQNCGFWQWAANSALFTVAEVNDTYKFDDCSFNNGVIDMNGIQPANITFVGCVSRNPGGANWIISGVAVNAVAVNTVTDKPTAVNVTLVAPSVGNQINIAI